MTNKTNLIILIIAKKNCCRYLTRANPINLLNQYIKR